MTNPVEVPDAPWWGGAVGYEIYIRSFADADGDGIGDLAGIAAHLDHLVRLGVDALWITPFFPSPGFDHGYDVSDYTGVAPIHGTLADFDALVDRAHRLGLRVVVDVVPNHTSSHHPWFEAARADPEGAYRDYYLWQPPGEDGGPPNNWVSHFGGPAWTRDEASGEYYCHLFLPEQPDLNWRNEAVRGEFDRILSFWADHGADGFRIDVAHGLLKAEGFPDNPRLRKPRPGMTPHEAWECFTHVYDLDQDETLEIYRRWRRLLPKQVMLLGEVGVTDPARVARYTRGGDGLDAAFFLGFSHRGWEPEELLGTIRAMHRAEPDRIAWVTDNHDQSRSVSRFGGGDVGARRSLALIALCLSLGGSPYLYQGQELGIPDGRVRPGDVADPIARRNANAPGRDGARTHMPWGPGPANGFTTGVPWLHSPARPADETVAVQLDDPSSWLHRHRRLLAMRRRHPDLWAAEARWRDGGHPPAVAVVERGEMCVVANLGPGVAACTLAEGPWRVAFATAEPPTVTSERLVAVPAESTVILMRDPAPTRRPPGEPAPDSTTRPWAG